MSLAEILALPFMQHALLAALFCSVASGVIGTLVALNRLSYLAGAIAHAAYGGIGIAFLFRLPALPCTMGFSLVSSLLMAHIASRGDSPSLNRDPDTAIGILWAAGMAFGIILIELSPGYAGDLMGFLFGSILAVPVSSLYLMAGLDLLLILLLLRFRQGLTALSLDPDFALSRGIHVRAYFFLLIGMTAIAVVMLLQVVGLILVIAMLTLPPHMARRHARTLGGMMALTTALCLFFCLAGLALGVAFNLSSGALIIAVATVSYCVQCIMLRAGHME